MPKRRSRRVEPVPGPAQSETQSELRQALVRRKKSELVEILMELAEADRKIGRHLRAELQAVPALEELIAATRQAIADATAFDPRDINRNFSYDDDAYKEVRRNLGLLIASGQLRSAMSLALELMKRGSHQVEMSDEGLMTEDIESGLMVVIKALATCDLPASEVRSWITSMITSDRMGFIARESLESLQDQIPRSATQ